MKWTDEAREAVSRVPFFVRKRVTRKVEEEAARCRSKEVTMAHVRACQNRFLSRMEEEVRGFQVETCFGPGGCPNRAVASDGLAEAMEARLEKRHLKGFLKERVQGQLKMHHEFRISLSDCPNGCSRPQIVDLGIIGASRPSVTEAPCSECGECVAACREEAVTVRAETPVIDFSKCLYCGQCIRVCPTGTLAETLSGYRILVGGKLGRHPRLGEELPGTYSREQVLELLERCLDHYQAHCQRGERFGQILEHHPLPASENH